MTAYCARCKRRVTVTLLTPNGTRKRCNECGRTWGSTHRGPLKW